MSDSLIFDFKDKIVVVTGAAGYLGQAFAKEVATLGAQCILVDKDEENLNKTLNSLNHISSTKHKIFVIDFTEHKAVERFAEKLVSSFNRIDTLINNAAFTGDSKIDGWATNFDMQSVYAWQQALQVNLISSFTLAQKLKPALENSNNASIINISSIYAGLAPDYDLYDGIEMYNPAAYGSSKAGLLQLTRWLASSLGPKIRVNAVSPGGIYRGQNESFVNRYKKKTITGRMANEEDIVPAIIFLTSEYSKYITGQNLIIDGGYSIK